MRATDFRKPKKLFWFLRVSFIRWREASSDFGKQIRGCAQSPGTLRVSTKSQSSATAKRGSIRDKISPKKLAIIHRRVIDSACKTLLSVTMAEIS